jgi:acyl-CoA synthetase (AMP-forming)/AMP-acid ligase II
VSSVVADIRHVRTNIRYNGRRQVGRSTSRRAAAPASYAARVVIDELLAHDTGSIPGLVHLHAIERPGHAAVVVGDERIDYAALDAMMDRVAAALQRDGAVPGGAIAIAAAASIAYVAVYLGAVRAGVSVAPLQPSVTAESLAAMIRDAGATHVFLDEPAARSLATAGGAISATLVALDGSSAGRTFAAWLAPAGATPQPVELAPGAPFNLIYSSGTTGTPKGIVQSHQMRWAHVRRGGVFGYGPEAVTLVSTPLYSNTTLVSLLPTLALGGTAVLMPRFDAGEVLRVAERHRVTHAMFVPVQYERILAHEAFDRTDLSSFRLKFCTSAPFSAARKAEVLRRWPGGLVEYFGMTEGGGTCVLVAHQFPDKLHTVGRPAEGHDLRVIDDAGRELPAGEVGEIVGASPAAMMTGYHGQPEATAATEWHDATGKRFIRTGDLGSFDADGFLTIVGRKKDVIISGGFNVYPVDLEAALVAHPAVAEAAVVGVPSARWGETPVGFVVLEAASAAWAVVDAAVLRSFANERLGRTQRLSDVVIVAELPRNAIGKVLKRALRTAYGALDPA